MTPNFHPPEARLRDHVAGGADVAAQALMDCHLAQCDTCAARVAGLGRAGGAFLAQQSPLAAPGDLLGRILERIDREPVLAAPLPFLRALAAHLPPDLAGSWRGALTPGFRFLDLTGALPKGVGFYLAHMAAGRPFPVHRHGGLEEAVILAGGFEDGSLVMEAGDWSTMAAATRHAPRALPGEDCWLVVRTEARIEFGGWRGLVQRLV